MCRVCSLPSITENNSVYQGLIKRRRDQGFKIYKLKGNLSWLRVLLTVCNLFSINDLFYYYYYYYYYFIIRDEIEFNDLNIVC